MQNIFPELLYEYTDYIPLVSTLTGLTELFFKCVLFPTSHDMTYDFDLYYKHLKNKSMFRCLTILVPVIGNIIVLMIDYYDPLERGLKEWRADPTNRGYKNEVVYRIRSAKTHLRLGNHGLNKLPGVIGQLTQLVELSLSTNYLAALPTELGRLTSLTILLLYCNQLTALPPELLRITTLKELNLSDNNLLSLPTEIGLLTNLNTLALQSNAFTSLPTELGQLTNLTHLDLGNKNLTSLPTEMGRLTNLRQLNIIFSQLTSLPKEIGQLSNLVYLQLHKTNIDSLPTEIGRLTNLTSLNIEHNPNLRELPMSLGQIPGLTHIHITGTMINEGIRDSILAQCRRLRDAGAVNILPAVLAKWQAVAKRSGVLDIKNLSDDQKKTLHEWLLRLEKTQDFAKLQSTLATTVCNILADAIKHKEFQELFFSQAEANNACCQDRAAMALNEIYTSWMILCNSADLQMMTGVAKTLCLRKELQRLIKSNEAESVEIFLYYESTLRAPLKLVTAIQNMTYSSIGKRDWIDEKKLIQTVNAHFFEELIELPIFEKMASEANHFETIDEEYFNKLGERPAGGPLDEKVLEYEFRQAEIMQELKKRKMAIAKGWYDHVIL